ncbi:MAG: IS200/IS605 family transposase [Polyangiales bacterium]
MSASFTRLVVHCVWSTSNRRPILDERRSARVYGLLARLCADHRCAPLAIGGTADHVHVLVGLHPSLAVADLVRRLKVGTSQFVSHHLGVPDFAWQNGYGAFSLRAEDTERLRGYVLGQAQHHANHTAVDEWERAVP